jgi:hypothetical protein
MRWTPWCRPLERHPFPARAPILNQIDRSIVRGDNPHRGGPHWQSNHSLCRRNSLAPVRTSRPLRCRRQPIRFLHLSRFRSRSSGARITRSNKEIDQPWRASLGPQKSAKPAAPLRKPSRRKPGRPATAASEVNKLAAASKRAAVTTPVVPKLGRTNHGLGSIGSKPRTRRCGAKNREANRTVPLPIGSPTSSKS